MTRPHLAHTLCPDHRWLLLPSDHRFARIGEASSLRGVSYSASTFVCRAPLRPMPSQLEHISRVFANSRSNAHWSERHPIIINGARSSEAYQKASSTPRYERTHSRTPSLPSRQYLGEEIRSKFSTTHFRPSRGSPTKTG